MENHEDNQLQFEYPTKFNKYRRLMMERQGGVQSCNGSTSPSALTKMETSSDSQKESHAANNSDKSIKSSQSISTITTTTPATPAIMTNGGCASQTPTAGFHHSPPKKIFISRACESYCQEAPLNLTTTSRSQQHEQLHSQNDHGASSNGNNYGSSNEDMDSSDGKLEAMDTSCSDTMNVEDHFKRSLGSRYPANIKITNDLKASSCSCYGNGAISASSPLSSNSSQNNNNNNFNHINNNINRLSINSSTPTMNNQFNFSMSAIFSPISLASSAGFNPALPENHFFANFLDSRLLNVQHGNMLFNRQQQQHLEQPAKRPVITSPSSSSSSSLHHSSSFNGGYHQKSSSPSCKSSTRHRYTPPDSYQPYPTDVKHKTAEAILKNTTADTAGCVDDHFSKSLGGDVWKQMKSRHLTAQLEDLMPTSVDDHFAKALGDKWFEIKSEGLSSIGPESPKKIRSPSRKPNFFSTPHSSFTVRS